MTNSQTIKSKFFDMVKEFQLAFNHPVADKPTPLTLERVTSRGIWEIEEVVEGVFASSSNEKEFNEAVDKLIVGLEKARDKSLKEDFITDDVDRIVAQADAFTDALYFNQGNFCELGVSPDELFEIVQDSNMSKLFVAEDGTKYAKYREEDGKILKSPEFFPPEDKLKEEVLRQIKATESK